MARTESPNVRSLLLVRNGIDHDARVLRAARVAERTLGGIALVVGVATSVSPAGRATVEDVQVLRLPPRLPRVTYLAGRRIRRVLSGLSFALHALGVARRTKPGLVHANDWNTMWCSLAIKLLCGTPVIYDSHELWADRNGRWEWRPWLLISERLFMSSADEVLTSSPGYADALAARYRTARPVVVRNIHERRPSRPQTSSDSRSQPKPPPSPPRVVYVGGLMPGRGLEQMIDSLPLLRDVRLCTIGPGAPRYRASLAARARARGVADRVELRAPVAPGEVGNALAGAAAGLCLIQPICRSYELCLPNKLFEYAAAGVPVLASDVPVIAAVVRDGGLGEVVTADDPRAIAAGLERLLRPGRWELAAGRVRAFADAHDWEREAYALAGVYERAVSEIAA